MTCVELRQSLQEIEDGSNAAQKAHLQSCPECSSLLVELNLITLSAADLSEADEPSPRVWNSIEIELRQLTTELNLIATLAPELSDAYEPSPRVWNSIEIALRQEGLIRPQRADRPRTPSFILRWGWARWMVPAAAALLIAVGVYTKEHSMVQQLVKETTPAVTTTVDDPLMAGLNDADLLQEVSNQTPAVKLQYEDNLRRANEYIHDAKGVADANPNDEEARRSLTEAYQQKALLFEMAMDRSGQ